MFFYSTTYLFFGLGDCIFHILFKRTPSQVVWCIDVPESFDSFFYQLSCLLSVSHSSSLFSHFVVLAEVLFHVKACRYVWNHNVCMNHLGKDALKNKCIHSIRTLSYIYLITLIGAILIYFGQKRSYGTLPSLNSNLSLNFLSNFVWHLALVQQILRKELIERVLNKCELKSCIIIICIRKY